MKLISAVTFAVLVVSTAAFAQSPPPVPGPHVHGDPPVTVVPTTPTVTTQATAAPKPERQIAKRKTRRVCRYRHKRPGSRSR